MEAGIGAARRRDPERPQPAEPAVTIIMRAGQPLEGPIVVSKPDVHPPDRKRWAVRAATTLLELTRDRQRLFPVPRQSQVSTQPALPSSNHPRRVARPDYAPRGDRLSRRRGPGGERPAASCCNARAGRTLGCDMPTARPEAGRRRAAEPDVWSPLRRRTPPSTPKLRHQGPPKTSSLSAVECPATPVRRR